MFWSDREEHDKQIQKVLQTLDEYNVTLNDQRCVKKHLFLCLNLSENDFRPASDNKALLENVREPKTPDVFRSILGLVNYKNYSFQI